MMMIAEASLAGAASTKLVLLRLAGYADDEGRHFWPSVAVLARDIAVSKDVIRAALRRLRKIGVLRVVRVRETQRGPAVQYEFDIDVLLALSDPLEFARRWNVAGARGHMQGRRCCES